MKKKYITFTAFLVTISVSAIISHGILSGQSHTPRANCNSDFKDQNKYVRGIFDVTIIRALSDEEKQICTYTLRINEILKSAEPITLRELVFQKEFGAYSCVDSDINQLEGNCIPTGENHLFFTADGHANSLTPVIKFNTRYNYLQPISKKTEILE